MESSELVGIIPAAGLGSRLQPLPFSKELYPIGFIKNNDELSPKAVGTYLLEHMQRAGAKQVYIVIRKGKWDIPAHFGDGSRFSLDIAYLLMGKPHGAPFTVDQAFTFVNDKIVLFGFPDILMNPDNIYQQLLEELSSSKADVVLGAFKVNDSTKWDMIEVSSTNQVLKVFPKPSGKGYKYGWAVACWNISFTQFMHTHLSEITRGFTENNEIPEISMGDVLQAAINEGLKIQCVQFDKGDCIDIGTPHELRKAILKMT